jgi:hypothetical protein
MRTKSEVRRKWRNTPVDETDHEKGFSAALEQVLEIGDIAFDGIAIKKEIETLEFAPKNKSEIWYLGYIDGLEWIITEEKKE